MNFCVVLSVFCFSSLVSALPVGQNGMVFFHMPYYNPYQTMLMHYMPQSRSASTSAFASGDAVAAGTIIRENRVQSDASRAYNQQESASNNDGNVEAIAEAYPEEPIQGTVQFDQSDEQQYNEVVPLNAAPVSEEPKENAEIIPAEPKIPLAVSPEPQVQTTIAPKKKVHIALDIPDSNSQTQDENDGDEEDEYPYAAQKPSRNGAPMYTYFPVSFGRAAGGTIAVANALSMGKGAVRSHAIAYGASGASRRQPSASERHVSAAHKTA